MEEILVSCKGCVHAYCYIDMGWLAAFCSMTQLIVKGSALRNIGAAMVLHGLGPCSGHMPGMSLLPVHVTDFASSLTLLVACLACVSCCCVH